MLSISFIRKHPQLIQKACQDKGIDVDVSYVLDLDHQLSSLKKHQEELQAQRNSLSKQMPQLSSEQRKECVGHVKDIKKQIESLNDQLLTQSKIFTELMLSLPQVLREDVPLGKTEADNQVIKTVGERPTHRQTPLSHQELGEKLGLMDFQRAVKISGSRSYVLTGKGAYLEQAILRMVYDGLYSKGYKAMHVPVLVREECMEGTGYFPSGKDQAYLCERDQLSLVGTSEVSLCSFYQDEIFDESMLPLKLFALSSCFRREAGSYGKDTKGLYRVHQFQKIEQVVIARSDAVQSEQCHDELMDNAEQVLRDLELPYQVVMVCSGDLGQGQYYKKDIETWMPSRDNYGETHSCSAFHDFQARRLKMRYRCSSTGKKHYCYTLNNTALASPRILIPFLEVHQTSQGDVRIPQALQPYCLGKALVSEL
ncbi:MAG: serine--tRNA ligase [Proteobacteria bacterium]|nr:serine--tRNA ligase [Pseudomonadota bacterium]